MERVSIRETVIVVAVLLAVGIATVVVLADDGAPPTRWRTAAGSPVTAGPLLVRGLVVVGTEAGDLLALEAETGAEHWRTRLPSPPRGALAASDGRLSARTDDGGVHLVLIEDGRHQWSAYPGPGANAPVIDDDLVLAVTRTGDAVGLRADDGREVWRTPLAATVDADPALLDGRFVVGDIRGRLSVLDSASGAVLQDWVLDGALLGPPLFDQGMAFAAPTGGIVAFDAEGERWRAPTGEPARLPIARAKDLLLVDASPGLVAVQIDTGRESWRYDDRALVVTFGVGAGLVVAGMHTGHVHGLDLATGERLWTYRTNGSIHGAPRVSGDAIYFGSRDGFVYAIEARGPVLPE